MSVFQLALDFVRRRPQVDSDGLTHDQRQLLKAIVNQARLLITGDAVKPRQWWLTANYARDAVPVPERDVDALWRLGLIYQDPSANPQQHLIGFATPKGRKLVERVEVQ